jgi:hypothetical protein
MPLVGDSYEQNYFPFDRDESWAITERQLTYGMELIERISKLWTAELSCSSTNSQHIVDFER